ncbi:MAG: NADH-quinone oxidoreductase subunit C [Tepidisphaeraceae bacterium]|jgi:NADH-quinone oxidoreductase subunit C
MAHRTINHPALAPLKAKFADAKFLVGEFRDMVTVIVPREYLLRVCTFLRDDAALRYDMLADINSIDYLNYPGAQHRFGVNYGLTSIGHNNRLWLKVFLDPTQTTAPKTAPRDEEIIEKGDPGLKIDSVTGVWPGAEWMEREVYDMMGIIFVGHPDLRRILTWNGFGSYPLRKDYPLRGVGEREDYKIVSREGA